jgi:putative membrane-bound dehydrogenase-like protein
MIYRSATLARFLVPLALGANWLTIASAAPPVRSADESLRSIQVAPGFKVERVAAEPLIQDPIAFEWGADGKLWIVEMGDYPLGLDGRGKPGGVVRFLEDTDGDGRYDKQATFLDGLGFPTGVMPWRNGVLVACAPNIFYAEDRNGDGRADTRDVLFTGFGEGNQQHRVNGFELGLDGWVYGANGDSNGSIRSLKTGTVTSISGRDFRFQPDTGAFEAETGRTQFGRHRDDWGHWFGNNNPNWGWHFVLADHDIRRNSAYAPPDPRQTLEPETSLYPKSKTEARFNDPEAANHVTSANSFTPYRDELFGPAFGTSAFVSEPVHNLVHRMILEPSGPTFQGRRDDGDTAGEFLASTDPWFRPTMLKTGPDGALWIADMYRAVIEHPQWIPDDWEKRLDLRAGSEEGRIYRVYPRDKKPRPIPRLDKLDTAGLVAAMESPSGWQRDTAQRLLLHRDDPAAIGPLRALVVGTRSPKVRVQALWTLADLGGLDEPSALTALRDPDGRVRACGVAAVWPLARRSRTVSEVLCRLADDQQPEVRFQAALALGNCEGKEPGEALTRLARRDGADTWIRAAILSSARPHAESLLLGLLGENRSSSDTAAAAMVGPLFALAIGQSNRTTFDLIVKSIGTPAGQGGRFASRQFTMLARLLEARAGLARELDFDIDAPFAAIHSAARTVVGNDLADEDERIEAVRLIGVSARANASDRDLLAGLLRPRTALGVQQAIVSALAATTDPKLAELLLPEWKSYSPTVRGAILDLLLSRSEWAAALLSALEDGCIPAAEIDPGRRARLLSFRGRRLRARAEAVFSHESKPRQAVVDAFGEALKKPGDRAAGGVLFGKLCASCHRLASTGVEVGPDLGSLNDRSPEALLIAILDPNRAFETKYATFAVATVDGRVLSGLVASETASAVTIRRQDGKDDVLLRSEIAELKETGQSLMPEGLEKDLNSGDLANLIAFLRSASANRTQP